jgi:hypothetical protein
MALPTLERTWQYNVNQAIISSGIASTDLKQLILQIKNSMIGFASNPWTVVSSSTGAVVDNSDLWATISDIMVPQSLGNPHSWIVLQQTGVTGGPLQLCIDMVESYYGEMDRLIVLISPSAGFTGGTISARPTATDEAFLVNKQKWISNTGANSKVLHVTQDSSGKSTRVFVFTSSTCILHILIETLADSALPVPVNVLWGYVVDVQRTATYCYDNPVINGYYNGTHYLSYMATEAFGSTPITNGNSGSTSNFTSTFPIVPISSYSLTGGCQGRAGRFVDLYMGSSGVLTGGTYPLTPSDKEFAQFLQFITPWNGTVVLMT